MEEEREASWYIKADFFQLNSLTKTVTLFYWQSSRLGSTNIVRFSKAFTEATGSVSHQSPNRLDYIECIFLKNVAFLCFS